MEVVLVVAVTWLLLLTLAVAVLRAAALADRAAERRLRDRQARRPSGEARRVARIALMVASSTPSAARAEFGRRRC